jgi:D-arabinose 1-dehydrogenase-like Zn-dependent alcohol dehydrogenase
MQSFDVVEFGKPLQARLRETPVPKGKEVLVRVTHSGVCHSDVHLWQGYFDLGGGNRMEMAKIGMVPPLTLGHEPYGEVVAVGPDVTDAAVGDVRLVYPWIGCDACEACAAGESTLCNKPRNLGIGLPGAYATHLLVPDERYLVDAGDIDPSFAATLACAGVTAYAAIAKARANMREGDAIAIIGCGGLGLSAISQLKAQGFENIIACDVDDAKLALAREQGATQTERSDAPDAFKALAAAGAGRLSAAIDFVGMPATFNLGQGALRKGGIYVICGLLGGEAKFALPILPQRSVSIVGSYVGNLRDLQALVELVKTGKVKAPPLQSAGPEKLTELLEDLEHKRAQGRTVLEMADVEG